MLSKRNHYSFTLVELLITVIIVGILAGIGISYYVNIVPKAKAAKAKHAITLITEAEKMHRLDAGSYRAVPPGTINGRIGAGVTGMNLAALDNDTDFNYSVTAAGRIKAINPVAIGGCAAGTEIRFEISTGVLTVPSCYR